MRKSSFTCKVRFHVRGMEQEVKYPVRYEFLKPVAAPPGTVVLQGNILLDISL